MSSVNDLKNMSNAIRALSIDAIERANSGHPGMPLGMADVATVLFSKFLKYDPSMPDWVNRDRFILAAGHGSMLLYAISYLTGYKDCNLNQITFKTLSGDLFVSYDKDIYYLVKNLISLILYL